MLMIAPAPVIETASGLRLDVKFVEGMRLHAAYWPKRITCLLRRGTGAIPFGAEYLRGDLPFDLVILEAGEKLGPQHLAGHDLIYAGADDFQNLELTDLMAAGQKIVFVIEYTPETRMQILALDQSRGFLGRIRGALWLMRQESKRRKAFRAATAIQSNGYPAYDHYRTLCANHLFFLDGRMTPKLFASAEEMAAREERRAKGEPLRLVYSGRLDPMKGAQDLVPVARRLAEMRVNFTLDIFGTGILEQQIRAEIAALGDAHQVRMHGIVDFETELVPFTRTQADVFLGCHRQSDPSCTYLEAMGCGVAIASYDNRMWEGLNAQAQAGWGAPMGQPVALAERIAAIATDPQAITTASRAGWQFAIDHGFAPEFRRRMEHLAEVAGISLLPVTD